MRHLWLLAGLLIVSAAAWITIGRLAPTLGSAAALAVGAILVGPGRHAAAAGSDR